MAPVELYRIASLILTTFVTSCCPIVGAKPVLYVAALSEAMTTPSEQRMPTIRVNDDYDRKTLFSRIFGYSAYTASTSALKDGDRAARPRAIRKSEKN